ncbi:MAG: hypothetical protein J5577_06235 [Bacteroidales bacterium]|nr:hypothetical protein [Bacteroidales bacterium]MBR5054616.1 hypothetical protein [Bacteroidales bacterium]
MKAPLLLVSLFTATDALPGKVGLITEWTQQQKGTSSNGSTEAETYAYSYDKAERLTGSLRYAGTLLSGVNTLTERNITYDRSGNLLTLDRYGDSSGTTPTESLSYTYTGPKRNTWTYDAHGNVTEDPQAGLGIEWNAIGLPRAITASAGTGTASTQRSYLADGTLAQVSDGTTTRLYLGDMVFNKAANGTVTLESAGWEGGRLLPGTGADKVLYVVKDHLGSVRVVKDGTGAVRQRFDYYPYGTVSRTWTSSSTTDNSEKRYRFGGKEIAGSALTDLVGSGAAPGAPYLDFGARLYSPRTAAWLSQDQMMESNYSLSPYAFGLNNPINSIDHDGNFPVWLISVGLEYGSQVYHNYREGDRGYDMWLGNVDLIDVAVSAVVPTGKLAIAKSFILETAKAGLNFSLNDKVLVDNDIKGVLKEAAIATAVDAAVSGVVAKSNKAVENAAKKVEETSQQAVHTANVASNRPASSSRATKAEKAARAAQEARTQQVGQEIANSIVATSPETTKIVVGETISYYFCDYDKERKYGITLPAFSQ